MSTVSSHLYFSHVNILQISLLQKKQKQIQKTPFFKQTKITHQPGTWSDIISVPCHVFVSEQAFMDKEVGRQQRDKLDLINVRDLSVLHKHAKEKCKLS